MTDFEPIEVDDAVDAPPSVFDATTKAWVEPGTKSAVDALGELVAQSGSVLVVDGDEVCSLGWARYEKPSQRVSLVTFWTVFAMSTIVLSQLCSQLILKRLTCCQVARL